MELQEILSTAIEKAVKDVLEAKADIIQPPADPLAKLTITPQEAATMIGVPLDRMYQIIKRDNFTTLKVGNRYLIPLDKFKSWVSEGGKAAI